MYWKVDIEGEEGEREVDIEVRRVRGRWLHIGEFVCDGRWGGGGVV